MNECLCINKRLVLHERKTPGWKQTNKMKSEEIQIKKKENANERFSSSNNVFAKDKKEKEYVKKRLSKGSVVMDLYLAFFN